MESWVNYATLTDADTLTRRFSVFESFAALLNARGVVENFEHTARRKDGSTFWVSVSARAVKDADGRLAPEFEWSPAARGTWVIDTSATTKAKRRATLSICGLAMLDETDIDSIPNAKAVAVEIPPALVRFTLQPVTACYVGRRSNVWRRLRLIQS